jgi:hypothetical protein
MAVPSVFGGYFNAAAFAYGCNSAGCPGALVVQQTVPTPASPLVAQSCTVAHGYTTTKDGRVFYPLATTASIMIGSDSNAETVTPVSVTGNGNTQYQGVSFTAEFADLHGSGDPIASATFGAQEAANYAGQQGGGIVVVDSEWTRLGGTTTIYNNLTLPSGVTKQDNRG